jgi:hypothetical protein
MFRFIFALLIMVITNTAAAQEIAMVHLKKIAATCPDQWQSQACLAVVGQSNLEMVAHYGARLQENGHDRAAETLKNHCAASTAARSERIPAFAMASAMTECSNIIATLSEETGLKPDLSHFQLMIAPVLCLSGHPDCSDISDQIKAYAR